MAYDKQSQRLELEETAHVTTLRRAASDMRGDGNTFTRIGTSILNTCISASEVYRELEETAVLTGKWAKVAISTLRYEARKGRDPWFRDQASQMLSAWGIPLRRSIGAFITDILDNRFQTIPPPNLDVLQEGYGIMLIHEVTFDDITPVQP